MWDALAQRPIVKESSIPYPDTGLGLVTSRILGKDKVFGYYYGSPDCAQLAKEQHKTGAHGEGVMRVTSETFRN